MDMEEFRKRKRNILKKVDKVTRYQNHTAFISTYLKMDVIPKGFALKFHNNKDFELWIRNLVTCHKGMNSTHDLNRTKRTERENLD